MRLKGLCLLMLTAGALLFACRASSVVPVHHALMIMMNYQPINKGVNTVIPYQVNLMAMDLLKKGNKIKLCSAYIQWYLNHINLSDKYGLSGTIYDYHVLADGREKSLIDYSNIDSTAASFVLLIHKYYKVTGFSKIIRLNRKKIEDVIYLIAFLQDEDGLIRSMPGSSKKFLKNNCEAYAAVNAFIELSGLFNREKKMFYEELRSNLERAVPELFYNKDKNWFYWLKEDQKKFAPDWKKFYPDSYSQLFPILYDMLPGEEDMQLLWRKFRTFNKKNVKKETVGQRLVVEWVNKMMIDRIGKTN